MSFDSPEKNAQFKASQEFQFELWSDRGAELAVYYGAARSSSDLFAQRISVLLDADGRWLLKYTLSGISGLYAHAARVLEDIEAIYGPAETE